MNKSVEPSNLQTWEGLFFTSFIKGVILPQTNNNLPAGEKHFQYGEFLRWLGLWMLMGTLIGPQRHELCELSRRKHEHLDKQIHMPWVHVPPP